ncbi:MAG TPA: class I SAM-dependent methyltransferase [Candidatus Acidoferrum sp.]|nr:class I SAM-dependent methyltransferase [Candidatus Acidoferrum sp.]
MISAETLYDDIVSQHYDRDHFDLQASSHAAGLAQLRQSGFAGHTALDIGCGTGNFLLKLHQAYPRLQLWGLDPSQKMLAIAKTKQAADYVAGTVETVAFAQRFDLISFHFVLAYEALEKLLDFTARYLAPNGTVLIGTTTMENFPETFARCDFLDFDLLSGFVSNPVSFDALQSRIADHGAFRIADHQPQVKTLEFPTRELLHEFVFHSGWASDISLAFKDQFEALINGADYPYRDTFKSHSLLLRRL